MGPTSRCLAMRSAVAGRNSSMAYSMPPVTLLALLHVEHQVRLRLCTAILRSSTPTVNTDLAGLYIYWRFEAGPPKSKPQIQVRCTTNIRSDKQPHGGPAPPSPP